MYNGREESDFFFSVCGLERKKARDKVCGGAGKVRL